MLIVKLTPLNDAAHNQLRYGDMAQGVSRLEAIAAYTKNHLKHRLIQPWILLGRIAGNPSIQNQQLKYSFGYIHSVSQVFRMHTPCFMANGGLDFIV
jgi:hypothetical protein